MKIFLSILTGLVALAVLGFVILSFSLGSLVKKAVNARGPEITQAKVDLGSAKISPLSGHGTLGDLIIGNPTGWTADHAFSLKEITLDVRPTSLLSDHIVIDNLLIDRPDIVYETKITSSNLQDLLNNIQKSSGSAQSGSAKAGKPVKLEIHHFLLQNGRITAKAGDRSFSFPLPTISLTDLGSEEGGLTPAQLSFAILKEVTRQAVQTAATGTLGKSFLDKAGAKASEGLRKLFGTEKNGTGTSRPASNP